MKYIAIWTLVALAFFGTHWLATSEDGGPWLRKLQAEQEESEEESDNHCTSPFCLLTYLVLNGVALVTTGPFVVLLVLGCAVLSPVSENCRELLDSIGL